MSSQPKTLRLLSMDGGDGRVTAHLLQRLRSELQRRGYSGDFLSQVNMFSGASAGGINSLLLAREDQPDTLVEALPGMWDEIDGSLLPFPDLATIRAVLDLGPAAPFVLSALFTQSAITLGLGALGLHSLLPNQSIRAYLQTQFGQSTLNQLKKTVAVVTFQLDNEAANPEHRRWTPRVFTNLLGAPHADALCLDVALRTSAQPVELPIFQSTTGTGPGFIDGGYVANNPAMVGIARLAAAARSNPADATAVLKAAESQGLLNTPDLPKVLLLSVGAGVRTFFPFSVNYIPSSILPFAQGSLPWGYGFWVLNPFQPFLLANVFFQAASNEVMIQVGSLLGPRHVHRLDPPLSQTRMSSSPEIMRSLSAPESQNDISLTADWLIASGWLDEEPPANPPTAQTAACAATT